MIGAYAALQNWGGLWRFTWCHGAGGLKGINTLFPFDAVNDPMQQLSDRIVIALFLRGDMAPAREKITFPLPRDFAVRGSLPPESAGISTENRFLTAPGSSGPAWPLLPIPGSGWFLPMELSRSSRNGRKPSHCRKGRLLREYSG